MGEKGPASEKKRKREKQKRKKKKERERERERGRARNALMWLTLGQRRYLGLPYSVDMGCTDDRLARDHNHPTNICGAHCPPSTKQYRLALPLYSSTTNCSGQTGGAGGSCNGDIIQANPNCCPLRPHTTPFQEEKIILGVIYGVSLWADMNAATPLGRGGAL